MRHVPCSVLALAAASVGLAPGAARADLDAFLKKPEPAYRWEKRGEQEIDGCRIYDLHLVSQVWQGITWEHRLQIFRPEKLEHPEFCTLYNTGGSGSDSNTQQGIRLAKGSGAVYAILDRLEMKGYVKSHRGDPTPERGGRSKRFFRVTAKGVAAVNRTQRALQSMTEGLDLIRSYS